MFDLQLPLAAKAHQSDLLREAKQQQQAEFIRQRTPFWLRTKATHTVPDAARHSRI